MSLLVAVKSCLRDAKKGYNQAVRDTWGKEFEKLGIEVRFFIGVQPDDDSSQYYFGEDDLKEDEIIVNCSDDYDSLPYKTKCIAEYVVDRNYDYVFLCDTDSYVIPRKLLACNYDRYDYAGRFGNMPKIGTTFTYENDGRGNRIEKCHPWSSGGVGYFLSNKAAYVIADSNPVSWAEDLTAGQLLGPFIQSGELKGYDIPEFECNISWHFNRRLYNNQVYTPDTKWLEKMYREHP